MGELEADGWILKDKQFTQDGLSKTNKYKLNQAMLGVNTEHYPSEHRTLPQCSDNTTLVNTVHPISPLKSPVKSPLKSTPIVPSEFDRFYEAYPRKVNRAGAQKAWEKLNPQPALVDRIMGDIAQRLYEGHWDANKEKQFIPHPSTYLNQQRWTDEITPRNGHALTPEQAAMKTQKLIAEIDKEDSWIK